MSRFKPLSVYGGGRVGPSAYDIYVEVQVAADLPVLSKDDWLASLKGENGYDDGPINDTLAALSSRVTAIEDQGPQQGYDDTAIVEGIENLQVSDVALAERIQVLEETPPVGYDDTLIVEGIENLQASDAALADRIQVLEETPPVGYDDTDIRQSLGALSQQVADIEIYDDAAIQERLAQVESGVGTIPAISQEVDAIAGATADLTDQVATLASTVAGLPAPYDDTALEQRVATVETAAADLPALEQRVATVETAAADLPALEQRVATVETAPRTTHFVIEDGHLVLIQSDGSKIIGPSTDGDPTPGVAPQLTGGSLTQENSDLVISPPTVTDGYPTPTLTMTLTRDGVDVANEVINGRIPNTTPGEYVATWTATNGTAPDATATDSLTISIADPEFSVEDVDGTPVIDAAGNLTFEITAPAIYAGTYTTDAFVENLGAALNAEYINDTAPQALKAPVIYRYAGPGSPTDNFPGTEYRFDPELLAVKSGAPVTVDYAWFEDGVDTGYDGDFFSRAGIGPVYLEAYVQVEGQALRTIRSNEIVGEEYQTWTDFAGAADGTDLKVFADASNRAWTTLFGTIQVYTGVDAEGHPVDTYARGITALNGPYVYYSAMDAGAIEAEAYIQMPAAGAYSNSESVGVALHIQDSGGGGSASDNLVFYNATMRLRDGHIWIGRKTQGAHGGTNYVALRSGSFPLANVMGTVVHLRLRREGNDIVVYNGDTQLYRATDTTLTGGGAGLSFWSNTSAVANRVLPFGLYQFNVRKE